jgi:hypothetical protein
VVETEARGSGTRVHGGFLLDSPFYLQVAGGSGIIVNRVLEHRSRYVLLGLQAPVDACAPVLVDLVPGGARQARRDGGVEVGQSLPAMISLCLSFLMHFPMRHESGLFFRWEFIASFVSPSLHVSCV